MEFLVEFKVDVPEGTPDGEVKSRQDGEAQAAAELGRQGHLLRVWKASGPTGEPRVLGLYRARDAGELTGLLQALPLYDWMQIIVTELDQHPNDPAALPPSAVAEASRA